MWVKALPLAPPSTGKLTKKALAPLIKGALPLVSLKRAADWCSLAKLISWLPPDCAERTTAPHTARQLLSEHVFGACVWSRAPCPQCSLQTLAPAVVLRGRQTLHFSLRQQGFNPPSSTPI